jgi:hypothetical protein
VHELRVPDGPHALELRVREPHVRLYGMVMEREQPGVVVDALTLIGAFVRVMLHYDREHVRRQVALREPDLLLFWLGDNDSTSNSVRFDRDRFVADYTEAIARARAGRPDASCLVMSVLDSAENVDGVPTTLPRIRRVVEAQREVATRSGCAFFDAFSAIGGENTMRRWHGASPRLVEADYTHLTVPGSRVVGTLLYKAMMKSYDDWLAR